MNYFLFFLLHKNLRKWSDLEVEVKAGGRRVSIRHTLQSNVNSFHKKILRSDMKFDGFRGVCGENKRFQVSEVNLGANPSHISLTPKKKSGWCFGVGYKQS